MNDLNRPRLVVKGLTSDHGGPFDLTLDVGECVSIMGASGAGKSLLLRMIADLDPGAGQVLLDGRERTTGRHRRGAGPWSTRPLNRRGGLLSELIISKRKRSQWRSS